MSGLWLKLWEKERFKIGTTMCSIERVKGPTTFVLQLEKSMNEQFEVTDRLPVQIMPGITVQAGLADRRGRAFLVINAPKEVRIERLQNSDERFTA